MSLKSQNLTYKSWHEMKRRCRDDRKQNYRHYGGRGIKVCERWNSFENFLADMGERPSQNHSIDRYPDRNGNYEPDNCRWATQKQQCRNRSISHLVEYMGRQMTLAEASELSGIQSSTIRWRVKNGYPVTGNPKTRSATGVKGVYLTGEEGKPYSSTIVVKNTQIYLGSFDSLKGAAAAYEDAQARYCQQL